MSKIDNQIHIIILQHPSETKNPKGSAIIAKLYLQKLKLWTGENFSRHSELNQLIKQFPESTLVVYPDDTAINLDQLSGSINPDHPGMPIQLIFIDASWRKAKKIWHLSENLHQLPCIGLYPDTRSNYRIRKIPGDKYLSTIESVVFCLSRLEHSETKYQPLLDVFNKMIDFQINKMGQDIYQANYEKPHGH